MSDGLEAAGALATAGLAAGALESGKSGARSGSAAAGHSAHGACLNCGAALHGAFCQACGQSAHVHRSLLHLAEELLHGLFHFDAKGWRTLPLLVARPGVLTRRYIEGQRVRYVSPLALFLFTVFLMFFAASLAGGPPIDLGASEDARAELTQDIAQADAEVARAETRLAAARAKGGSVADEQEALDDARQEAAIGRKALATLGMAAGASASASAASGPASAAPVEGVTPARKRGVVVGVVPGYGHIRWLDAAVKRALANPELTLYKLKSSAYKYSFLLVPISLPFLALLFARRRDVVMYDHAVFVLYSLSFMSLLFVVLEGLGAAGLGKTVGTLAVLVPPVHMGLQLRDAYRLGLWSTLWRTAALVVVAGLVFILFVLLVGYLALA